MFNPTLGPACSDLRLCERLLAAKGLTEHERHEVSELAKGLTANTVMRLAKRTRDRFATIAKRVGVFSEGLEPMSRTTYCDQREAERVKSDGEASARELAAKFTARDANGNLLLRPPPMRRAS